MLLHIAHSTCLLDQTNDLHTEILVTFLLLKNMIFFNFFVISIILTLILAFCSKYQFWGISQILQITFQSQGQFTLRERKRKFLKNVHQRLHVNYFRCFLKNLSSVQLYSLFTCPVYDLVTIFACALSVIQFPLLTNCKQQSQKVVLVS